MTTPKKPAAKPVQREEVTLIDRHTHAGKAKKKGDKIYVTALQKQWLIDHKKVAGPAD